MPMLIGCGCSRLCLCVSNGNSGHRSWGLGLDSPRFWFWFWFCNESRWQMEAPLDHTARTSDLRAEGRLRVGFSRGACLLSEEATKRASEPACLNEPRTQTHRGIGVSGNTGEGKWP